MNYHFATDSLKDFQHEGRKAYLMDIFLLQVDMSISYTTYRIVSPSISMKLTFLKKIFVSPSKAIMSLKDY